MRMPAHKNLIQDNEHKRLNQERRSPRQGETCRERKSSRISFFLLFLVVLIRLFDFSDLRFNLVVNMLVALGEDRERENDNAQAMVSMMIAPQSSA